MCIFSGRDNFPTAGDRPAETHTHACARLRSPARACARVHAYEQACARKRARTRTQVRAHMHAQVCAHARACAHARTRKRLARARTHASTRMHVRAHVHAHTHEDGRCMCTRACAPMPVGAPAHNMMMTLKPFSGIWRKESPSAEPLAQRSVFGSFEGWAMSRTMCETLAAQG
jgi:hypothetical protein